MFAALIVPGRGMCVTAVMMFMRYVLEGIDPIGTIA